MYFRGMSDWNLAELEDIDWDVFGRSDDRIVPHHGVGFLGESSAPSGGAQKKPRHEVKNGVGKDVCSRGSATETVLLGEEDAYYPPNKKGSLYIEESSLSHASNFVVPTLCNLESTANRISSPSQDGRNLGSCVNEFNTNTENNIFCSKGPSLGTVFSTNDSKSCLSSCNGVSSDVTDFSFLERQQNNRDNDLAYYDWPDIGNFEDIDTMFRNWDSTFGQEQTGPADELSWFSSSSNTVYSSEIAYEPGFRTSNSDLGVLHAKSEPRYTENTLLPKNIAAAADHDKPTPSNNANRVGTDAPSEAKPAAKEKSCDGGNEMENIGLTQISNEYSLNQSGATDVKIEKQQSSEDKGTKRSTDEMLLESDFSAQQMYSSQQFPLQKLFIGSSSSYMHNLDPHSQLEFGLPTHGVPFTQMTSGVEFDKGTNPSSSYNMSDPTLNHPTQCLERFPDQLYVSRIMASENIEKLYGRQQLCGTMTAELSHQQPAFRSKASVQKELPEIRYDTEMENVGLEPPTIEINHPIGQESSGMTSASSDYISEWVTSFQQLQDVMHQLDVRTKMCIRDSLYRLARSARQRHAFDTQNCSEGTIDKKGIQGSEASKRSGEFMDAETNTNPIDRSIAHLLFHKPLADKVC